MSLSRAFRSVEYDYRLSQLHRMYAGPLPSHLVERAQHLGWSEARGWPVQIPEGAPDRCPIAYLFDVPGWAFEGWMNFPTLELVAGKVTGSKFGAIRRTSRLRKLLGHSDLPLLFAMAVPDVREMDEWQIAALRYYPSGLALPIDPQQFFAETFPATAEARDSGMTVNEFAEYIRVTSGRIPPGAISSGVPAEYAAVL